MNIENSNKSTQEEIIKLEDQKAETIANLDGALEGELEKKIQELKKTIEISAEQAITTPEYQQKQIIEMGGTMEELQERTKEIDQKIETAQQESEYFISQEQGLGSLKDGLKQQKFEELREGFLKYYQAPQPVMYDMITLSKEFKIYDNMGPKDLEASTNFIESIPKSIIEEMIQSQDSSVDTWKVKNALEIWKNAIGPKIGQMSNDRDPYFDNEKNVLVQNGIPKNAMQYLETVANAARFVPKEVSEKFIKDAISAVTDKDKNDFTLGGAAAISLGGQLYENPKELNLIRNLIEAGYQEEAKQLVIKNIERYGYTMKALDLEKLGIFSKDEVMEMTNAAGKLDEPKSPTFNNGWE